jgi:hypothetical protein
MAALSVPTSLQKGTARANILEAIMDGMEQPCNDHEIV